MTARIGGLVYAVVYFMQLWIARIINPASRNPSPLDLDRVDTTAHSIDGALSGQVESLDEFSLTCKWTVE
jgi:hypothetical protein